MKKQDAFSSAYQIRAFCHDHPLSYVGGQVAEHRRVLFDSIGPGAHPCHWCQTEVTWQVKQYNRRGNLVVDHVDGDRWNNALENLVPSCGRCNSRRAMEYKMVKDDEVFVVRPDGRRARAVRRTCATCGDTFLVQARLIRKGAQSGKEHGTFCSRTCANKGRLRK